MNIAHIIESAGGSAEFVLYTLQYQKLHNHYVIAGERAFKFFKIAKNENRLPSNVEIIEWNVSKDVSPVKDLKAFFQLKRILNEIKPDAIHATSSKAGMLVRLACFMGNTKKVFYSPQGAPFLRLDVSPLKRKFFLYFERVAHFFSGNIVACSRSEAEAYINNGMNATYISNGTNIFETNLISNDSSKIIIATVGRVTNQKNPELFNNVAKQLINYKNIQFLWIGGGEHEDKLTSTNIEITGWKSRLEIDDIVKKVDIYISTALWEGLPFAVLEAMNLNKPLLLYPCVGNIDLIENNLNGYFFKNEIEAEEKILKMIESKTALIQMGKKSAEICSEKFDIITQVEKFDLLYQGKFKGDIV